MRHVRSLILATVALSGATFACAPKATPPPAATPPSESAQKWTQLQSELDKMSPQQRADYLKQHPEALKGLSQP